MNEEIQWPKDDDAISELLSNARQLQQQVGQVKALPVIEAKMLGQGFVRYVDADALDVILGRNTS